MLVMRRMKVDLPQPVASSSRPTTMQMQQQLVRRRMLCTRARSSSTAWRARWALPPPAVGCSQAACPPLDTPASTRTAVSGQADDDGLAILGVVDHQSAPGDGGLHMKCSKTASRGVSDRERTAVNRGCLALSGHG